MLRRRVEGLKPRFMHLPFRDYSNTSKYVDKPHNYTGENRKITPDMRNCVKCDCERILCPQFDCWYARIVSENLRI